jgi:hypothetical protein
VIPPCSGGESWGGGGGMCGVEARLDVLFVVGVGCCEGEGNSPCGPRVGWGGLGELLFQGEDVLGGRGGFPL